MRFGIMRVLMGPEGQGGGGTGGGSGGGANGGLSQEAWDAIETRFTSMLQGGISSMSKRLEKQSGEKIDALTKLIEGLKTAPKTEEGEPGPDGKAKGRKEDIEMSALKRQVELLTSAQNETTKQYEAERAKNRATDFKSKTTAALDAIAGIKDPFMAKIAMSHLREEGRIEQDEDGEILFVDGANRLPLDMGLKSWAKSDEAKRFQPPTGVKGSGSRPTNSQGGADAAPTTQEGRLSLLGEALKDAIG